jgi:ELWxxDGT repeat protein
MVADINPGANSSNPQNLVAIGSTIFFTADDGTHGVELWKCDGTTAGTTMVKDIVPGAYYSPSNLTDVNGTLFFAAGGGLWKSDGTAAGTMMVIFPQSGDYNLYPSALTNVNGTLYFSAWDVINGRELWKSDGTAAGTMMVKDIFPGYSTPNPYSSYPSALTNVNGTLFFTANDGVSGWELWKSDGTAAGTNLVRDINPGYASSDPDSMTNVNGTLFFTANDGVTGRSCGRATALLPER